MRRLRRKSKWLSSGGHAGPQVMPGTYTVRLTWAVRRWRRLQVRLDPAVSNFPGTCNCLSTWRSSCVTLQSSSTDAVRTLDSLKEQLQQIEKTVKDRTGCPEGVDRHALISLETDRRLQNPTSRAPRLAWDRRAVTVTRAAGVAFSAIEGTNAAPTLPRGDFTIVEAEFVKRYRLVNRF